MPVTTLIWDLGGVLVDWNPRYLFTEAYFGDAARREQFLQEVCTMDWNEQQDAGYPIARAVEEKVLEFPSWEPAIRDYYGRWEEMLCGPLSETVELFREVRRRPGLKCYALTNWSAELFPIARQRFDFLQWFDGLVVSGEEGIRKPFPGIYERLLQRYDITASEALFIDDNIRNVQAAEDLGIPSVQFTGARSLRNSFQYQGII